MNGQRASFQASTHTMCVNFKKNLGNVHSQNDGAERTCSSVDIQSLVRALDVG